MNLSVGTAAEALDGDLIPLPEAALPAASAGALATLHEFVTCAASYRDLDECVSKLVALVARIFEAHTCVVVFAGCNDTFQTFSNHGREEEGAAAQVDAARRVALGVLESGLPVLLEAAHGTGAVAAAPIRIDGVSVGAMVVTARRGRKSYGGADLRLLDVVTRFVDKSVEVIQLRCLLNSRFAQLAALSEAGAGAVCPVRVSTGDPEALPRLIARSFYREMTRAGFGSRQIINAASEIISQLSDNIKSSGPGIGGRDAQVEVIAKR